MRILHINANYITSALHQTMVEHLIPLGVDNNVFVGTYDKSKAIVNVSDNVTVSECFKRWDRLFFYKKQKKIIDAIESAYDINDFDLIHAYTLFTDGNAAMELSKKYGIPYVIAVRNTDVNKFLKYMVHLRHRGIDIMRNAAAIFFLSPAYKNSILSKYVPVKYRKEILNKSFIISNGIDDFWQNHKYSKEDLGAISVRLTKEKRINCIYVGAIDKNKNVELTLKALVHLNSEGWKCKLTAVGGIKEQDVYKRLCQYDNFVYIEPKKKEELISYYRDADIFVMPSHSETFGLVYAEAMSQGLPVIYTRGQGFDGQFEEGYVGYSVSDESISEVCDAIIKIVERYSTIEQNCIDSTGKFLWSNITQKYYDIYTDILKNCSTI